MKKAPIIPKDKRKKYDVGGNVPNDNDQDDPRKKAQQDSIKVAEIKALAKSTGVPQLNTTYPSAPEQQGFNKSTIKKDIRTYTNTGGGTNAAIDIKDAGSKYKKGGEVKKMTKAPFRFKKK